MRLRQDNLTWHVAGDDVVVLDLEGSVYLKVNGTGRVLWEALQEPSNEEDLQSALIERYDIDAQRAAEDVAGFLAELRRRKVLED